MPLVDGGSGGALRQFANEDGREAMRRMLSD